MVVTAIGVLGTGEEVPLDGCEPVRVAGAVVYRAPAGRLLAPAFRSLAVDLGTSAVPAPGDDDALGALVLRWVEAVRAHDWTGLRGVRLEAGSEWLDLRAAMVRVGWGPAAAQRAWDTCRQRPYARSLPTAAGWAAAGWVVPAVSDEPDPTFARPVLEARGLMRWAYIERWSGSVSAPDTPLPFAAEPRGDGWADVLSRLRQDHHTERSLGMAADLALEVLHRGGLGSTTPDDVDDDPLPDRDLEPACSHASALVRASAAFLLHDDAERWLACTYAECQHHWAIEAEEDAYELEEVLEFVGHGVANPVDAAYQRRRLLSLAFGDVRDVPLAGAGGIEDFIAFYEDWVAGGRSEDAFLAAVTALRGDREEPDGG